MNKMNLPAPFGPVTSTPPIVSIIGQVQLHLTQSVSSLMCVCTVINLAGRKGRHADSRGGSTGGRRNGGHQWRGVWNREWRGKQGVIKVT